MNLEELRQTVSESAPSDWHQVTVSGPTYRYGLIPSFSPSDGSPNIEVQNHSSVAVFKADIDLSIVWGMAAPGAVRNPSFNWAKFDDPEVTTHLVDVFWRGSLVDRVDYVAVDGYRCVLPIGWGHQGLEITRYGYAVAQLIDRLQGGNRFDEYASGVPYEFRD